MSARILQLSDFHLLGAPDQRLRGVPTTECLRDVLQLVRTDYADADQFILSGDIASDGEEAAYRQARELWDDFGSQCRLLPGNHDDRALMRRVFPELTGEERAPLTFSQSLDGWRLIGLDTLLDGSVEGDLENEQLVWLRDELKKHREQPTLLFMHHPPIGIGSSWLDRIMLTEPDSFSAALDASPQVRGIFCGHVHQEFEGRLGTIPVFTTPATGIQFTPGTEQLQFEDIPPGFRVIDLEGDQFETYVIRLPELKYPVEPRK